MKMACASCLAHQLLPSHAATSQAYGYYAGGSDNEWTLAENKAALGRYRLLPRVLVDVSTVDMSTTLLGELCWRRSWAVHTAFVSGIQLQQESVAATMAPVQPPIRCRPAAGIPHPVCAHGAAAAVPPRWRAGHGAGSCCHRAAVHTVDDGNIQHPRGGRSGGSPARGRLACRPKPLVPGALVLADVGAGPLQPTFQQLARCTVAAAVCACTGAKRVMTRCATASLADLCAEAA